MQKKVQAIYISNILEGYYKSYTSLKLKEEQAFWTEYDTFDSNRALFYGGDNKIIITSTPICSAHFTHIKSLMNWKNVTALSPSVTTPSLSDDCRNNRGLHMQLTALIKANPGVALIPYRLTPQFQRLIHYLHRLNLPFTTPETMPEKKQFILNYFNTKRGFRHLWHISHAGSPPTVQIPEGFITQNKKEAIEAAWWFMHQDESFVVKYNSGVQGIGVELLNHQKLPQDEKEFKLRMKKILADSMWNESIIVVEKAIAPNEKAKSISPSLEIYIDPFGKVSGSYACDQILAGDKRTFRGIYIYPELMHDPVIEAAFAAGIRFGKKLSTYGYRGVFDIDLIRSTNREIYAVEANLRRNGGTHLHELCLSLLGKKYGETYHALIEDIVLNTNHQLTYERCMTLFKGEIYTNKKHTGLLIANPDMLKVHILSLVIITKTKRRIKSLRAWVDAVLQGKALETSAGRDW